MAAMPHLHLSRLGGPIILSLMVAVVTGFRLPPASEICCSLAEESLILCANSSAAGGGKDAAPAVHIALVTLATPEIYGYAAYTAAINAAYAKTFGHSFQVASTSPHLAGAGQQLVWRAGNVATILDVLESGAGGADWIAYMDADACLVDFSAGDALVSALRQYAGEEVHLLMSRGELIGPGSSSLFNSGFALLRNHPWTVKLVRLWWSES
ncbi:unnamed protein product [Polarella glacialis]|uniref:Nucleotide-diphospho-sugar transferase domain-containing protein n=1 Tax=Polarella glacialis TaxID=89957 RepID=A0A813LRT0_POLGL|nr:unnamed protein product [Polarella glacialis]